MRERIVSWIAYKLPRYLVYWCAIRLYAEAYTKPPYHVMGSMSTREVFESWKVGK